jgi:SsrA-binding protein
MAKKSDPNNKLIAENRRARFDYHIESDLEVGIMLLGSEVKSLRQGGSNIAESYASGRKRRIVADQQLYRALSAGQDLGSRGTPSPQAVGVTQGTGRGCGMRVGREGMTLVPLKWYFNDRGMVKVKLGVAKGKKWPTSAKPRPSGTGTARKPGS